MELGLSTGVSHNWECNKRLGKDFFMEFLELRLNNTKLM